MYYQGEGVPKDEGMAYFWWLLSSAVGNEGAIKNRDIVENRITPKQRANVQALARNWKPK